MSDITSHKGFEPFVEDGRLMCDPLPGSFVQGTLPQAFSYAQCRRSIKLFRETDLGTSHSPRGATLWVIKEWCQTQRKPLYITGDPHTGWHARLIYPGFTFEHERDVLQFIYQEQVTVEWLPDRNAVRLSRVGCNAVMSHVIQPYGLMWRRAALFQCAAELLHEIVRQQNPNLYGTEDL